MAIGDAAAAKGMDLVDPTDDLRVGAEEDNRSRDYLAAEIDARLAGDAAAFPAEKVIISATFPAVVVNGAMLLKPVT